MRGDLRGDPRRVLQHQRLSRTRAAKRSLDIVMFGARVIDAHHLEPIDVRPCVAKYGRSSASETPRHVTRTTPVIVIAEHCNHRFG